MFRGLRCWAQQATVRRIYKEILWPCISKTWKRHLFTPWRPKFGEKMVTDKKLSYRASCPCFSPMNWWAWRPLQRHGHKKKRIFDGWLWPHAARDSHVAANTTVLQCTRLIATKDGYRAAMTQKIDLAVFWDLFQSVSVSIRTWKLSLACKTWRNFGQSRTWTAQGYPLQKAGWVLASCHEDWRLGSQLLGVEVYNMHRCHSCSSGRAFPTSRRTRLWFLLYMAMLPRTLRQILCWWSAWEASPPSSLSQRASCSPSPCPKAW